MLDERIDERVGSALDHFINLNIRKLSWLTEEGLPSVEIKKPLETHGLTCSESFAIEMAADLMSLREEIPSPASLKVVPFQAEEATRKKNFMQYVTEFRLYNSDHEKSTRDEEQCRNRKLKSFWHVIWPSIWRCQFSS